MFEKSFEAVIFDMDGVLIDSESVYLRAAVESYQKYYPWITEELLYPTVGMSEKETRVFLAKLFHCSTEDAELEVRMREAYASCHVYYPDIMRPVVPAVLQALKQMGLKLALASSSSMKNIETVLTQCGTKSFFDVIVSGEAFQESKPNPEIYLYTMEQLHCAPQACLIVEDSTYGVAAGVAAGGSVAALRDDRYPFDQRPARFHIESLKQIPDIAAGREPVRSVRESKYKGDLEKRCGKMRTDLPAGGAAHRMGTKDRERKERWTEF